MVNVTVLDIWHWLFRGVDCDDLIDSEVLVSTNNVGEMISTIKSTDRKLASLLLGEEKALQSKGRKGSTRHSIFVTTMAVQLVCSLRASTFDKKNLKHKPINS